MEKLIMLGTGTPLSMKCYNSCFALQFDEEYLLVDGGGGNGIVKQLSDAHIPYQQIHNIYLSQGEPENLFGIIWVIKMIGMLMRLDKYKGELKIYCHSEMVSAIRTIASITLPRRFIWLFDHRILFVPIYDGDVRHIMDHSTEIFEMEFNDRKQLGFSMTMSDGRRLAFAGTGLLPEYSFPYVQDAYWLMHEAFCLHSQIDFYRPYENDHCSVRDACETAAHLGIPELIMWQTEEDNLARRSELYTAEARLFYKGRVIVPKDLEVINLV